MDGESTLIRRERLRSFALLLEHDAEIEPVRRLALVLPRSLGEQLDGLLKLSGSIGDEAKEMVGLRMMRICW